MAIIGIDLGTTNSLAAYFDDDGAHIIPNRLGDHLTPSIVSIDENGEVFVGRIAKQRLVTHPTSTVSIFKRSMGSQKKFPFGTKEMSPEELASFVIRSLKEDAEEFLGETVTEAVISVPAYFNDVQRKATKHAGELAGLTVDRLINEPTAAAIAYGLQEKKEHTKFLVFDLGGGTFDVSILELFTNIMEVRGVAGDNYLGGEDFTEVLEQIYLKKIEVTLDTLTAKDRIQLRKQAEITKCLFGNNSTHSMKCRIGETDYEASISIEEFEKESQGLLTRLRRPIERALSDASIKVKDIDTIVLVGGATRLAFIRKFVGKLFGKLPAVHINPDEVVALGASVQAAMKARQSLIKEVVLTDVCPYTLGTDISVQKANGYYEPGHFMPIIERNTIIPVSRTERVYTLRDNQKTIRVEILQGEGRFTKDNIMLGEINVPIPMSPAGTQSADIRYTYDINGILEVEVTVVATQLKKRMVIEKNPGYMSEAEIEERLKELEKIKIHPRDQEENRLLVARGERIYEESVGDIRNYVDNILTQFETILDKQDPVAVRSAAAELKEQLDQLEIDWI